VETPQFRLAPAAWGWDMKGNKKQATRASMKILFVHQNFPGQYFYDH